MNNKAKQLGIERNLEEVNKLLKKLFPEPEERTETWQEIDRRVDSEFLMAALDRIPEQNHEEFVKIFTDSPNDQEKIFGYLEEKGGKNVREELTDVLSDISKELVHDLLPDKETTTEIRSEGKVPVK